MKKKKRKGIGGVRSYKKEVKVGDAYWDVKFVREIPGYTAREKVLGLCEPGEENIYIKLGQKKVDIFYTWIHEVIHACENEYDFNLKHSHVYKLEKAFGAFLIENFDALKAIMENDPELVTEN